ncbi:MAG: hypothetical protein DA330_06445 [Nitrososphaera sp.]|nr:hypothetical protein [Nitrososphaera sp.]
MLVWIFIRAAGCRLVSIQDNAHRYFATTVGLITTNGKNGPNVMAAEWTMQVSYEPMLISIFIRDSPTLWNIKQTGEFGVNIASDMQAELVNIAGGYSGSEIQKFDIPGIFDIYKTKTGLPMIKGCALNAECKVQTIQEIGDHVMVVGQTISAEFDEAKKPLIYSRGNYWKTAGKISSGRKVAKISEEDMAEFKKMAAGQFVLKAAAALIKVDGKTLFVKLGKRWTIPIVAVQRGKDYKSSLQSYLKSIGIEGQAGDIVGIERMMLKSTKSSLRANFIVFQFKSENAKGRWAATAPRNTILKSLVRFA